MDLERSWIVENTQLMVPLKCLGLFLTDEFVNTGTLYTKKIYTRVPMNQRIRLPFLM
jgi:hypothetical protein